MAFDGIFSHYIIKELNQNLLNGRINKIYQISSYELIFVIRANNQTQKLLISINPNYARCHVSKNDYSYPKEPPMFCMLLRKHLEGGIIVDITQKDNDRVFIFSIEHLNEIGDKDIKLLIVEIMGKHSNIILLNQKTNIIIDSVKHISPFLNSYRTLQPGALYIYPPTNDKINFFKAEKSDFETFNYEDSNLSKQLVQYFEGMSPLSANELIYNSPYLNAFAVYCTYLEWVNYLENNITPTIINTEKKAYFYITPLKSLHGERKYYKTIGEMLDRFYFKKDEQVRIKQHTEGLEKFIKNEIEKYKHKLTNLETDLLIAKDSDKYRIYGELIMANSYHLTKGMASCKIPNFYESNKYIEIELDSLLTPIENSQKYFAKYQKAKKAVGHITEQIKLSIQELIYFETLYEQIQNATLNDALEIRQELVEGRYLKRSRSIKQKKNKKPLYETFIVDDTEILVGKNNLQNDYLTHKLASKNDTWLHAKDMPGSHVIIRSDNELSENVLRTAAQLAAYYSKGKLSSSVPIDYTKIKYVKKISGAKPGFVTYDSQKTIYIDPDEDFIHSLKKQ